MPDIKIAVTRVAAATSTGNQDITTSDLGGKTPKAALFYLVKADVSDVDHDDAVVAMGACTVSGTEWCASHGAEDGRGTSQSDRHMVGSCIAISDTDRNLEGEASFVAFITNGVRINWSNAPSGAWLLVTVLFAGADLQAHADIVPEADIQQGDSSDINDAGFTPDAIFMTYADRNIGQDAIHTRFSHGMAARTSPITNVSVGQFNEDGEGTSRVNRSMFTDKSVYNAKTNPDEKFNVSAFIANGFTIDTVDDDAGGDIGYLALEFGGAGFDLAALDSPTGTGNEAVTGVGFKPQFVWMGLTTCSITQADQEEDSAIGISAFTEDAEFCQTIFSEDGASTTNENSHSASKAIDIRDTDSVPDFEADFVSMDSDGFTLDYTKASSPARKWFYFAVEIGVIDSQGQVSFTEFEVPDSGQGQVSFAELETPNPDAQGQVSFAEFEVPENSQGQISFAEFEVPQQSVGQVSFAEFELPNPVAQGQVSWAELEIPTQEFPGRAHIPFAEFEIPDPTFDASLQFGFVQFETPDVTSGDGLTQITFAEFKAPSVNVGGTQGNGQVSFTELEVPDAKAIMISSLQLETPDPRRRGRVLWARVEFASVPGPNRQQKIVLKDINRELFLEELDVYGIKPDVGFFLPGFEPLNESVVEGETDVNQVDPQRVWTPKTEISQQFGQNVDPGEMFLDYSFVLTEEDLFHIQLVCHQHDATRTTEDQDVEDQFFEDLAVLRDYATRCDSSGSPQMTDAEKDDCHCRLLRFVLRLATETTVRRIQDDPFTTEPFDLGS